MLEINGIYLAKIPLPFPLKWVNCYLIPDADGWAVIDTGVNYKPAQEAWANAFQEVNLSPQAIRSIYLTHYHPDHLGLAGWLQEQSGAQVFLLDRDCRMASVISHPEPTDAGELVKMFLSNGLPQELLPDMTTNLGMVQYLVRPSPRLSVLHDGDVVSIGGTWWQVIWTPGHSDGHMCLYCPDKRLLLSGDHVLPHITPNISLWPGAETNPLDEFLSSLDRVADLEVELILPAHGKPFHDLRGRVEEIKAHHRQRLAQIGSLADGTRTAYDIAMEVFGTDLSIHEKRFALGETLAHLEYMAQAGRLTKILRPALATPTQCRPLSMTYWQQASGY